VLGRKPFRTRAGRPGEHQNPPGTQNGQKLRVRARGLPTRDGARGDLMVVTRIAVPAKVTDAEKKLWEQLARESKFNPRI